MNRILWNARDEDIDEIVLHDVKTVHIEQMSDQCWWIGIDMPNGGHWAGNFFTGPRSKMHFAEQGNDSVEWDEDESHDRPVA